MTRAVAPYGRHGLLVDCADTDEALALHATVRHLPWVTSSVPGAQTLLVITADSPTTVQRTQLATLTTTPDDADDESRAHTVEVHYDGDDLDEVADRLGRDRDQVIIDHTTGAWAVAFCGFAPGFGYLRRAHADAEAPRLEVPRRDSPRTTVPAGAVGLAGPWSGIYPRPGPGGWQLIGHTHHRLWNPADDERPALLAPGDRVRFVTAGRPCTLDHTTAPPPDQSRSAPDAAQGALLTVTATGALSLFQDGGRYGYAAVGVPGSGPADRTAARRANRLVGNPETTTVIESLLGGLELSFDGPRPVRCAVTGSATTVRIGPRRHGTDTTLVLRPGDRLTIEPPTDGLRCYLAVEGGPVAPAELGSGSTDVLSGLGPDPVVVGQVIMIGSATGVEPATGFAPSRPYRGAVPVTLGPRDSWLTPSAVRAFLDSAWTVTAESNRVGVRLTGPRLERAVPEELASEPLVRGAIQVPPSGQPIVFGPDHPTTGGYPVLGCVVDHGHDQLAQLRPGDTVRFTRVG